MLTVTNITEGSQPYPIYNKVLFEILSDNSGFNGFRYVVALELKNDIGVTSLATAYYDTPIDVSQPITIDVSRFFQQGFRYNQAIVKNNLDYSNSATNEFRIKCYEFKSNAIDFSTEVIMGWYYTIAASFSPFDRIYYSADLFNFQSTANPQNQRSALTDLRILRVPYSGNHFMSWYNGVEPTTFKRIPFIKVDAKMPDGSIVSSNFATPINFNNEKRILHFRFNAAELALPSNALYYNVYAVRRISGGAETPFLAAKIYPMSCTRYNPIELVWMNRYGVFDSYNFSLASFSKFETEKKTYKREYKNYGYSNLYSQAGGISDAKIFDATMPTYHTREKHIIRLTSNYLDDTESVAFRQLLNSPLVYIASNGFDKYITNSGQPYDSQFNRTDRKTYIACKLIPNTYEMKKSSVHRLYNLELEVELSEHINGQVI